MRNGSLTPDEWVDSNPPTPPPPLLVLREHKWDHLEYQREGKQGDKKKIDQQEDQQEDWHENQIKESQEGIIEYWQEDEFFGHQEDWQIN